MTQSSFGGDVGGDSSRLEVKPFESQVGQKLSMKPADNPKDDLRIDSEVELKNLEPAYAINDEVPRQSLEQEMKEYMSAEPEEVNTKEADEAVKEETPGVPQQKEENIGFKKMIKKIYSRQSKCEKFLVVLGCILSFINGAIMPTYALILGLTITAFDPSIEADVRDETIKQIAIIATVICIAQFVFGWLSYTIMQQQAEKMTVNLKSLYLNALMKQETAFFEKQQIEALPSKISENFFHIQEGSGEKLSQLIQSCGAIFSGFLLAFAMGPVFAAIMMGIIPFFLCGMSCLGKGMKK